MASPKQLRSELIENRAALQEAFHTAHGAWERKPGGAAEGEEAWSPRQVAEHVIGSEWFFANQISQACGAPALERPAIDASTPGKAAASLSRVAATCDNILRHVSDADMEKTFEGPRGTRSVDQMLTMLVQHVQDHAAQISAASA